MVVFFLLLSSTLSAGNLEKGWEAFAENRLDEAETYFKQATSSPGNRAEAYVGLVLLKTIVKDEEGELKYFKKAMEYYPDKSALAFAMYESMQFTWSQSDLNEGRMELIESLVEDPSVHGTVKASLYNSIGDYQFTLTDFKDSRQSYEKVGAVKEWSTVGTFENISGSGFDKIWEPLKNPRRTGDFMNKREAPVNWKEVRYTDEGVWINLAQRYDYSN
ncbi:MAG: tetratricopeptide repeat protein, partial [Bacteroidota bacterium]